MDASAQGTGWKNVALALGRLIFAALFAMAVAGKVAMSGMVAQQIAAAGFPMPMVLNWLAALLEVALVLAFLSGAWFREACLVAAAYVIFLAFAFHGPSHWTDAEGLQFGAFVSHFPMAAGLLFGAVSGPGRLLAVSAGWMK